MDGTIFIPLMVIIPIICAILVNLIHGTDKLTKIISVLGAICLPLVPIIATYGNHYFGGYQPLINGGLTAQLPAYANAIISGSVLEYFHPAITYAFGPGQQMILFILGIVAMCAVFISIAETRKTSGVYLYLLFMLSAALLAFVLTDDIFNLYVFFEIAALVQVGLILVSRVKGNYETGLKYMLLGEIGGSFLLLGIGLLLGLTGNVNISDMVMMIHSGAVDPTNPVLLFAAGMLIYGWLYATGLPPFNAIKSEVYSKGLPSGAMILQSFSVIGCITIGLTIIRIFGYLPTVQMVILAVSVLAMILGISMAMVQDDYKRIIAYLAVGELGYIGVGLGLGTPYSITAGLFQAVNELVVTSFLFIGFGLVLYKTKTSKISKLGGLLEHMPVAALLIVLAGFTMAGVPPFNVFQSKYMLCQAAMTAGIPELAIIMIILSIVTFLAFLKITYAIFLRPKPDDLEISSANVPKTTMAVMFLFLIICLVIGLCPDIVTSRLGVLALSALTL
ncbi:energy conserving hydrogenase EhbF [uncultured Methanosphaera sp.]|uniref:energy conserving hydrogenase EhbF n=1 Tax=uncultured Methanosphaera sp. TaxID=262501 RepID=UPI000DC24E47|nr:energy conserving hydrogenase EhbF [uncultured Methanosphaera sp.]RAP43876.1 MAG: hydrogenase [Methanosphaera sp. SHI1033]